MFCVYKKVNRDQYKIYDSEDLTLDICTVDDIRNFIEMGIKIKGVAKSGKSLKISVSPPKSTHITKEVCSDALIEMLYLNWGDKDKAKFVYNMFKDKTKTVCHINKNGKHLAMFIYSIKDNILEIEVLELLRNDKDSAKEVLNFLFKYFNVSRITAQTPAYNLEVFELAGARYYYDIIDQRQYMLENEGLYTFEVVK